MVARIARVSSQGTNHQVFTDHLSDLEFQAAARDRTISLPPVASVLLARELD